ncbi:MAG: FAD-binding oxidoreductase [Rhizobiales bacterium]|nr:FAD-binding oxidoreductase [Hyphomicrobiales bacterium]
MARTRHPTRRDVLKTAAALPAILAIRPRGAAAAGVDLPPLPEIASADATLLRPGDAGYAKYDVAHNIRTRLDPALRALCRTPAGVAQMVDWVRENDLPFAVRCGGHSYEGFSQSASVVIDVRPMAAARVDRAARVLTIGAGASLGAAYQAVARQGLAFAAGSCPTVGISGHTLGGGYGLLARPLGLTADNLLGLTLVDAHGRMVEVDAAREPDLFWACRGGGGGSFGIATEFRFKLHPVTRVVTFKASWTLPLAAARDLFRAWQAWLPTVPVAMTPVLNIASVAPGRFAMRCVGQSLGSEREVRATLGRLTRAASGAGVTVTTRSFLGAVNYFSGGSAYPVVFMKAKSDYAIAPVSEDGAMAFLTALTRQPPGAVSVLCDAYGGIIGDLADDATAFAHRKGTLYSVQYYASWTDPAETAARLAAVDAVHAALHPHMSGGTYVNYPDLELTDWQQAYWGGNLPRLRAIKRAVDPANLFTHAQSVPPA